MHYCWIVSKEKRKSLQIQKRKPLCTHCIHVCIVFSFYLDFSLFEIVDDAHDVSFLVTIDDEH